MKNEIIYAIIQAATEFLPISSSGHLAIASNIISEPDLFMIVFLHLASLLAVIFFTRRELRKLLKFDKESINYLKFIIIAIIPAAIAGLLFRNLIEMALGSFLFIGFAYMFTGTILLLTRFSFRKSQLNSKNSLFIGLMQVFALFPGVSRSGMTISASLFSGIDKEKAVKFSFIIFIPLVIGATILEINQVPEAINPANLIIPFLICFILSILFLNFLTYIIKKDLFWIFSIYCYILGIICFTLYYI